MLLTLGFVNAQREVSHQQILNEAYFDYLEKGYQANQWPRHQSKYVDDIRKKEFFEKPTSARKMKKAMAVKREQKRHSLELRPQRGPGSRRK